jgi:hypothetical protein
MLLRALMPSREIRHFFLQSTPINSITATGRTVRRTSTTLIIVRFLLFLSDCTDNIIRIEEIPSRKKTVSGKALCRKKKVLEFMRYRD